MDQQNTVNCVLQLMKQWYKIQCMLPVSITDLLALHPRASFLIINFSPSLPIKHSYPWWTSDINMHSHSRLGLGLKKPWLPSSSASDTDQVPGGLANPELNRALSTVRHLRNALRWWRGGYSNNEKSPIKLSGLERTSSTTPPLLAWELPVGHCWLPTHREPNPPGSTNSMPLAAAVRFLLFHVFPPALMANALSFRKMTLLSMQVGAIHSIHNRSTQLLHSASARVSSLWSSCHFFSQGITLSCDFLFFS